MPRNSRHNSQCQVEILLFVRGHSVVTSTISLRNKVKNVLTIERSHFYNVTIQRKETTAIFLNEENAIEGLLFCLSQSKSVSRVKKQPGSDFCSLLPGNTNALPRNWHPKLAEHFPTTRIAIIGKIYFAISRDCSEQWNARWRFYGYLCLYFSLKRSKDMSS